MRSSDWSSDVCSSDLAHARRLTAPASTGIRHAMSRDYVPLDEKPERRIGLRTLGIVGIVAFLIGAIAIGYAIKNYGHWFEGQPTPAKRSEEHTSELQSLMRISYAVFCLTTKNTLTK